MTAGSDHRNGLRLGVTGHQDLASPQAWIWVRAQIRSFLEEIRHPIGISSLARGADQEFAEQILQVGGLLEVVLPFPDYEIVLHQNHDLRRFRELMQLAQVVHQIPPAPNDQQAYLRAGHKVVDLCETLVAVWDGAPARGLGGTADAVSMAVETQRPVFHINPTTQTAGWLEL